MRKGVEPFKKYVLEQAGYTDRASKPLGSDCDFKVRSRIEVRDIRITMSGGSKKKVLIDEKQVVFWNKKYALKAQAERDECTKKAHDIIADPKKYDKDSAHGGASYIKNILFDKKTGEIITQNVKLIAGLQLFEECLVLVVHVL